MPLPNITIECRFGIDLILMHIDRTAQQFHRWADHARMMRQQAKSFVIVMCGKRRANYVAALFPPNFRTILGEHTRQLAAEHIHFFLRKCAWQKKISQLIELIDLVLCKHVPHIVTMHASGINPTIRKTHCVKLVLFVALVLHRRRSRIPRYADGAGHADAPYWEK